MGVPDTGDAVPFKVHKLYFCILLSQHAPVFAFIHLILYSSFCGILKPKVRTPVDISTSYISDRVSAKGSRKKKS